MAEARRVAEHRRSLLIALPPTIARVLEARDGATLHWHRHRAGEVVLSRAEVRKGGPPASRTDAKRIRELEREVDKLHARLTRQRETIWNEYRAQEVGRRLHLELKGYPALDAINDRLRGIEQDLARLAGTTYRRAGKRAEPSTDAPPSAPPPSEPSGGDAASGGEAPQAAH